MTNALAKTTTAISKFLPKLPTVFTAGIQLVDYVNGCEAIRKGINEAIDYKIGEALAEAKEELPHGEFLTACAEVGFRKDQPSDLIKWYQSSKISKFDPAIAEQKMSRGARTEFCRADAAVKELVIADVSNPEIAKITAADIKRMAPARELQPGEATHPDYNKIGLLFDEINQLLHQNEFTDNFSREEWFSILGAWQACGGNIQAKCDYIRRSEQDRSDALDVDAYEAL